jgi:asparagine synthetase B (glutamine-hydrolysing)
MMEPVLSSGSHQPLSAGSLYNLLPAAKENIQVWGYSGGNSANTAVIFNNKLAFHKQCFDRIT